MVLSTEWSQVEVIDLINDGNGLGFILVGGKSTGVVIKALIPGGISERDGRLQCGDHVLQIGEVNLRGFSSEQVATVLRQTGSHVRIIVARPVEPTSPDYQALASHAPIIPTKLLTDPDELERQLIQTAAFTGAFYSAQDALASAAHMDMLQLSETFMSQRNSITALLSPCSLNIPPPALSSPGGSCGYSSETSSIVSPETETYEVELRKNVYGLGITVAGYVCEVEDLSGIFVKSIIEGSAAEKSGKIQINDRIVAVDGRSLAGSTNHQAVELLRNTDIAVRLTLERFLRGRKYEHLQVALTEVKEVRGSALGSATTLGGSCRISLPPSPSCATLTWVNAKSDADSIITIDANDEYDDNQIEPELGSHTTVDSNIFGVDRGQQHSPTSSTASSSRSTTPIPSPTLREDTVAANWGRQFPASQIVVAELNKLAGLGISLEGTVDVEGGIEKRPHHFIRSILNDGPVATEGSLRPGDEILQVNEHRLQGLKHTDVVKILKELPQKVKMVCARGPTAPSVINTSQNVEAFESRSILQGGHMGLMLTKAQSESSLYTSSTATLTDAHRSKSVEHVSGLALWSSEVVYVDIEKVDCGFGFSILDYQDPIDPEGTVIVVRGLIPGGAAESSQQLFPGDRIISVGDVRVQGGSLDEAVDVLKGMPLGMVRIGLCRPLCVSDDSVPNTPT